MDKTRSIKKTNTWLSVGNKKAKSKGSTRLTYTGLIGGLEHLKTETRLIDEILVECVVFLFFCCYRRTTECKLAEHPKNVFSFHFFENLFLGALPSMSLVSVKRSPDWSCDETKKTSFSGDLASFLVYAYVFNNMTVCLFLRICLHVTYTKKL